MPTIPLTISARPRSGPIEAPLPDWLEGVGEVALRTLVRVELPGRAVRLSITMDEALAGAVDRAAAAQGFTRSGFLAEAARPACCASAPSRLTPPPLSGQSIWRHKIPRSGCRR